MKKISISVLCLFVSSFIHAGLPKTITVKYEKGILLRESLQKNSPSIGAVHYLYSYPVIDGEVTYIKVALPENKQGWVFVGGKNKLFDSDGTQLTSKVPYNISVKSDKKPYDSIGVIKPMEVVTIIDKWYGRLKVEIPGNKQGWIFNGPYHSPWTQDGDTSIYPGHYFADFSEANIITNMTIEKKAAEFNETGKVLSLFMPKESAVSLGFTLKSKPKNAVLSLTHRVAVVEHDTEKAPISIKVNGQRILSTWRTSSSDYATDSLQIERFLKAGENNIEIEVEEGEAYYRLKAASVRYK